MQSLRSTKRNHTISMNATPHPLKEYGFLRNADNLPEGPPPSPPDIEEVPGSVTTKCAIYKLLYGP
jgi:hypothetical protein